MFDSVTRTTGISLHRGAQLGLVLCCALLVAGASTAADKQEAPIPACLDASGQVEVETEIKDGLTGVEAFDSSKPFFVAGLDLCKPCFPPQTTAPVTKVGATCLRARQKAAAAARELAVCSLGLGYCSISHSVEPCQPITNGYSATAVAYYRCKLQDCD